MNASIPLERQLIAIMAANREDSYATQRKRSYVLASAARDLIGRFGLQKWDNLKQKHITYLVDKWKEDDSGRRSIEESLSHMRWLLGKIGKPNLLPRSNADLGIEPGLRHTRAGKIISDPKLSEILGAIQDPRIATMILLARRLGLRFKEASLFRPWRDWAGDRVWVKRGTKGGRPRYLFIHSASQEEVLERARELTTREGCLVPPECATYEEWRQYAYRVLRAAGVGRVTDAIFHDFRRTYLVERMEELVKKRGLEPDRAAALVAREAGHSRAEILAWYLVGRGAA